MKSKHYKLFSVISKTVMTVGTNIGVKSACPGVMYQPKVPKHLA
jgi:cyclic lactone autoinducer peptide